MTDQLNLTRAECAARSAHITPFDVAVDLDLSDAADPAVTTFLSRTTLRFASTVAETWLDLVAEDVVELVVNGTRDEQPEYDGARLTVTGLRCDGAPNTVQVLARCSYTHTGEGMHRFTDPVDDATYAYTHFEPTDARRVFSCFEQPDLKARYTFTVSAPDGWHVYSNQCAAQSTATHGVRRTTFAPTLPISSYLAAVAAGPFHQTSGSWQGPDGQVVPLSVACRASMEQDLQAQDILTITGAGLDFFSAAFEFPYPWGKYDQVFLPEYNIGAMEHPGLVTFNENAYLFRGGATVAQREARAEVIMHEMSHMWFGDLVTPKWWDDTWLKEPFADLMGYLAATEAAGFEGSWVTFALQRKQWAYEQDQLPTTHPVIADVPDLNAARQNFDGITYAKGAAVLKQLMAYVGRDAFLAGARRYFRENAFQNTTFADLLACLDDAAGEDLTDWAQEWLRTTGPSHLRAERRPDGGLTIIQTARDLVSQQPVERSHRVVVATFAAQGDGLQRTATEPVVVHGERTDLDLPPGTGTDLIVLNDEDLTYAVTRLDPRSARTALDRLGAIDTPIARAAVWSSLWNQVRDGELSAADHLAAVGRHAVTEADSGILAIVLRQAHLALTGYLPSGDRAAYADSFVRTVADGVRTTAPGSECRRTWIAALARSADLSAEGRDPVLALLNGDEPDVTPSLRWDLLAAAAASGSYDERALAAERAKDPTMSGATGFAKAMASLPGSAVKRSVWQELTTGGDLTNDRQRALLAGFARGENDATAEFGERYVQEVLSWWASQPPTMAARLTVGLFPHTDLTEVGVEADPTLNSIGDWLQRNPEAPAPLRRVVVEQLDLLRGRLRAQHFAETATRRAPGE